MNLGKIKHDMGLRSFPETDQLTDDGGVVEKGEFVLPGMGAPVDPGLLVELIIIAKAALIQKLKDHFTALAAEYMIPRPDVVVRTIFPAMVTLYIFFNEC